MGKILLIDDEEDFCRLVHEAVNPCGHDVTRSDCAESGLKLLLSPPMNGFDVVLLDQKLPGMKGIELLEELRSRNVQTPVILITEHGTPDIQIAAAKLGVFKYFTKPLNFHGPSVDKLLNLIRQAIETSRLTNVPVHLPNDPRATDTAGTQLVGVSEVMGKVWEQVGSAACTSRPVLITGETGTGKELVARALFSYSDRAGKPLVKVNCAAAREFELDEELFGRDPGLDGGCSTIGAFEQAHGGAVLLDDVGDCTPTTQAKILQVVQEKTGRRCGRGTKIPVDVWIIATSQTDLQKSMDHSGFNRTLYYSLERISLPPLRDRVEDIEQLASHFRFQTAMTERRPVPSFHEKALEKLRQYAWPGNVRELQEVVRRAVLICRSSQITAADLDHLLDPGRAGHEGEVGMYLRRAVSAALKSGKQDVFPFLIEILERELLLLARTDIGPDLNVLVEKLGIPPNQLRSLLKKWLPNEDHQVIEPIPAGGPTNEVEPKQKPREPSLVARAIDLIPNCSPAWKVKDIAKALGVSRPTLYRSPIIKRLLDQRKAQHSNLRRGFKDPYGRLEAYDQDTMEKQVDDEE